MRGSSTSPGKHRGGIVIFCRGASSGAVWVYGCNGAAHKGRPRTAVVTSPHEKLSNVFEWNSSKGDLHALKTCHLVLCTKH